MRNLGSSRFLHDDASPGLTLVSSNVLWVGAIKRAIRSAEAAGEMLPVLSISDQLGDLEPVPGPARPMPRCYLLEVTREGLEPSAIWIADTMASAWPRCTVALLTLEAAGAFTTGELPEVEACLHQAGVAAVVPTRYQAPNAVALAVHFFGSHRQAGGDPLGKLPIPIENPTWKMSCG